MNSLESCSVDEGIPELHFPVQTLDDHNQFPFFDVV